MVQAMNKLRWAELDEEDDEDLAFLLPPKQVIGPDGNGMKKVIEYKFNEDGNKVKITTTSRVRKLAKTHLSKSAVARRSWSKFGDAVKEDVGACLTVVSTEEVLLERPKAPGTNTQDAKSSTDLFGANKGAVLMICRTCGKKGDHWTSRCPYKDLSTPADPFTGKPADSATDSSKGTYIPPSQRGGERPTADMRRRNDENAVRVTNLSEDTREADLHELFRPFGSVTRVFVPIDHSTGLCRGFAYVNFAMKEDAERAIKKLNGYGYDSLILSVEWSAPRPK